MSEILSRIYFRIVTFLNSSIPSPIERRTQCAGILQTPDIRGHRLAEALVVRARDQALFGLVFEYG